MKKIILSILLLILAAVLAVVFFFPNILVNLALQSERFAAGLEAHHLESGGNRFAYLDNNKEEEAATIIFVHGFGGDKDNFSRMAGFMGKDYRLILVDMPGFGESTRRKEDSYDIQSQAQRLDDFIRALKVGPVHLVGNSMGGHITAVYTYLFPDNVRSLALIDSSGVDSPIPSEKDRIMEETGVNPLLVNSVEDFDRLMNFVFVTPPWVPSIIKSYFAERAVANRGFNQNIYDDLLMNKPFPIEPFLDQMITPTLVLWGDTDRVIHVSAADVFAAKLPNSTKVILTNTGHTPMLEKPKETADHYLKFLTSLGF